MKGFEGEREQARRGEGPTSSIFPGAGKRMVVS